MCMRFIIRKVRFYSAGMQAQIELLRKTEREIRPENVAESAADVLDKALPLAACLVRGDELDVMTYMARVGVQNAKLLENPAIMNAVKTVAGNLYQQGQLPGVMVKFICVQTGAFEAK